MIELRFCQNCESPFSGRLDKKYCSGNCRKRLASADKTQKKAEKKEIKTIGFLIELPVWRRLL